MIDDFDHDLGLLRSLLARELETINHYRLLASRAEEGDAREFFLHIVEEEKLHVADVLRAIARLDADQARLLESGYATGHAPGETPTPKRADSPPPPVASPSRETSSPRLARTAGELTIGSLRRMPQDS